MSVEQLITAWKETGNIHFLARALSLASKQEVVIIKEGE